jgi:hypothetical protein
MSTGARYPKCVKASTTKLEKLLIAYDEAGDKPYSEKNQKEYANIEHDLAEQVSKLWKDGKLNPDKIKG